MHILALHESEVTDLRRQVLLQPQLSPDVEREIFLTTLAAHLPGNGGNAQMSSAPPV
jgi:hypothetical protein